MIADGGSDPKTFARQARRLIDDEKVERDLRRHGPRRAARRSSEVVGQADHLFIFPSNYEGLDLSQNVICTGPFPNQQVIPAVNWCFETLKARKFFLAGSDDVMSYASHTIIQRPAQGAGGVRRVGESFVEIDGDGVAEAGRRDQGVGRGRGVQLGGRRRQQGVLPRIWRRRA